MIGRAWVLLSMILMVAGLPVFAWAQMDHPKKNKNVDHSDHGMILDREGMVMNHNPDQLPEDCDAVSSDVQIDVRVGTKFARTGLTFGYSQHEWRVAPCSRLNITFVNEDQVRHQWMVHGLPKYLYPQGMFHLEVNGGFRKSASFIVSSDDATLLVHCDISHHMEQGLKGQIVVGGGALDIPGIPGLYAPLFPDKYP
ncbi:MAG TPA: copper oxidase [Sneathiellales bacterium]|nr:copper oxidase [Sneathiellales bacterium]